MISKQPSFKSVYRLR